MTIRTEGLQIRNFQYY